MSIWVPPSSDSAVNVPMSQLPVRCSSSTGARPICAGVTTRPSFRENVSHKTATARPSGRVPPTHMETWERDTVRSSSAPASAATRKKCVATWVCGQPVSRITSASRVLRVRAIVRPSVPK